jgi:hypothetical protein
MPRNEVRIGRGRQHSKGLVRNGDGNSRNGKLRNAHSIAAPQETA